MSVPADASEPLEGIVLHLAKVGDTHRMVDVLTVTLGRVSLLARGARASKKRFGGVLEVFSSLRLHTQLQRSPHALPVLQAADVVDSRFAIRKSFEAIGRASALCACVRRLVPEQQPAPDVHALLHHGLDAIAAGAVDAAAAVYPRLAAVSGILPDLSACPQCGRRGPRFAVVAGSGTILCSRCAPRGTVLSEAAYAALLGGPIHDAATATVVEGTVLAWVAAHTGRPWRGLAEFVTLPQSAP